MKFYRPTWAEVKLANIAHNYREIKKRVKPDTRIMACVKADAYGHGLVPVAKKLVACKVDYLSVASIDEGVKLREAGIRVPILVLGLVLKKDISPIFKYNLTQTICTEGMARALNNRARKENKLVRVHVKIDTGMGRLGVMHYEALDFVKKISQLRHIIIEGLFTHLACADVNRAFTIYQINIFEGLVNSLDACGIRIPFVHAAKRMGILGYRNSHFNMVRPGLILYGLYPQKGLKINLKPVLSLKTKVVYVKDVPKGWGISYGHTYVTNRDTAIVTLPIGYGDGYPRNLSNTAPVIINKKHYNISGRVCMDQTMVDVGSLKVKVGDEVVLIGSQGKSRVTAEELAELSDTIPYEIVCGLGSRVPRVYV